MSTKWGIISSGKISNDFTRALTQLPREEHEILAIAARNQESAASFAKEHNIPIAYDSYEKIAADKNIDVVYIGSINPTHYKICKMMLEHGKHVLCEKPLTLSYAHTEELISSFKVRME